MDMKKYIDGMHEIHCTPGQKKHLAERVLHSAQTPRRAPWLRGIGLTAAACAACALLLWGLPPGILAPVPEASSPAVTGSVSPGSSVRPLSTARPTQDGEPSLKDGFIITAWSGGGGEPLALEPGVEFPLGRYSLAMSAAPGFPFIVDCAGADVIGISADAGQFLRLTDATVTHLGSEAEMSCGETLYWSPLPENGGPASGCSIELIAYGQEREIARTSIVITSGDDFFFYGTLAQ